MPVFNSSQDYFEAVQSYIDDLKASGYAEEAQTIQQAFRYINGLTDGWASYLDGLLTIESKMNSGKLPNLTPAQCQRLKELTDFAYKAVYRKNRKG